MVVAGHPSMALHTYTLPSHTSHSCVGCLYSSPAVSFSKSSKIAPFLPYTARGIAISAHANSSKAVRVTQARVSTVETAERSVPFVEENEAVDALRREEVLAGDSVQRKGTTSASGMNRRSVHDYMEQVPEIVRPDGGPPRWFSPLDCGRPPKDAPLLFFLPGMDGTGLGLILHHEDLGKLFEVRCLHIPVKDRTPFEGLVEFVEQALNMELSRMKSKPIYIVGDSLGGALALSVAARNPVMNLVLVLSNPATSFNRSQLQPFFPLLEMIPDELYHNVPYLLSFTMGDPISMASVRVKNNLSPLEKVQQLSNNLVSLLPTLPTLATVIPKEALLWKLKLLQAAALYTNSRLHAVTAEVLLLASGKDRMLPSAEEAKRLKGTLKICKLRYYNENGHTLLLEKGVNLATVIKKSGLYRNSKRFDYVKDFVPPTEEEFTIAEEELRLYLQWTNPVFFSTFENGKVVQGLSGVPSEGPVLFVGNHMLLGLETAIIIREFMKQRKQLIRGMAHPYLFTNRVENSQASLLDQLRLFGAVPVSGKNLFTLLSRKEFALLFPGGAREGLHRKGEEYKLFWSDQSEFVRMAARFNATIVPFSVVGEDDLLELLFDYDDLKKVPFLMEAMQEAGASVPKLRSEVDGEVANQPPHVPIAAPKLSGRIYVLFGKPFSTSERKLVLQEKETAHHLYLEIKRKVEAGLVYLQKKRKEDPYRDLLPRLLYEISWGGNREAPTFEP